MYGTMDDPNGESLLGTKKAYAEPEDCFDSVILSAGDFLSSIFSRIGRRDAASPWTVIGVGVVLVGVLVAGMAFVDINSDPNAIWVPPTSTTSLQQNQFNAVFNPFYRIEQVIFSLKPEAA